MTPYNAGRRRARGKGSMARSWRVKATVGVVLLALFIGTAPSQQPPSQGTQPNPAEPQVKQSEDHQRVPDAAAQGAAGPQAPKVEPSVNDGNDDRQKSVEREYWTKITDFIPPRDTVNLIFTGLVAIFTGLLTYFTYLLYRATRQLGNIAQKQHSAMMASVVVT